MRLIVVAMVAVLGIPLDSTHALASLPSTLTTADAARAPQNADGARAARIEDGAPSAAQIELAQNRPGLQRSKPPPRGSSAELNGGSSADRYGSHSADRNGVAGRYDTRNRSVRQFDARHRKREEPRKKQDDELDDQDEEPERDRLQSAQQNPFEGRRGRD